jgi:hypothetical protein
METISEQAKDLKLYEQICRAILPEKDLKKVVLAIYLLPHHP